MASTTRSKPWRSGAPTRVPSFTCLGLGLGLRLGLEARAGARVGARARVGVWVRVRSGAELYRYAAQPQLTLEVTQRLVELLLAWHLASGKR